MTADPPEPMGQEAEETIKRLMRAYDVHDEEALAIQMQRDPQTLRVWRSRDAVPLRVLVDASRATGVSLAYLQGTAPLGDQPPTEPSADVAQPRPMGIPELLSERELQVLQAYRAAPDTARPLIEATVAQVGRSASEVRQQALPYGRVTVDVRRSTGVGSWREPANPVTPADAGGSHLPALPVLLPATDQQRSEPLELSITIGGARRTTRQYIVIPRYATDAKAGRPSQKDAQAVGLDEVGELAFSETWLRANLSHTSGRLASIRVSGDSMDPTLRHGESIIIDTEVRRISTSGIYVLQLHGDHVVKRVERNLDGSATIRSDNAAYKPQKLAAAKVDTLPVVGLMVYPRTR